MNSQQLRVFSFVEIDRANNQKSSFIYSLLLACVDCYDHYIYNPNLDLADNNLLFYDNIIDPSELKEYNLSK